MKCRFCSYSCDVERKRDDADKTEAARLIKVLGQYRLSTNEKMLVSWIGGEPFLWKPLFGLTKELNGYGIDVSTTTHGLSLSREDIRQEVVNSFSEIVFSLDGFKGFDDNVRQFDGHFDIATKNIAALNAERKAAAAP